MGDEPIQTDDGWIYTTNKWRKHPSTMTHRERIASRLHYHTLWIRILWRRLWHKQFKLQPWDSKDAKSE